MHGTPVSIIRKARAEIIIVALLSSRSGAEELQVLLERATPRQIDELERRLVAPDGVCATEGLVDSWFKRPAQRGKGCRLAGIGADAVTVCPHTRVLAVFRSHSRNRWRTSASQCTAQSVSHHGLALGWEDRVWFLLEWVPVDPRTASTRAMAPFDSVPNVRTLYQLP